MRAAFLLVLLFFPALLSVNAQEETDFAGVLPTDSNYAQLNTIRPSNLVSAVINLILGGSGVASFAYLLWGGAQWLMAGGDKDILDKARKKITAALIGVSLVFSSYALLFIIQALFGINLIQVNLQYIENTNFPDIPAPSPPIATSTPAPPPPTSTPPQSNCNPLDPNNRCAIGPCGPGGQTVSNCTCYPPFTGCNPYDYPAWCMDSSCP